MAADYLDVLRKRNLLTWAYALLAALLMNIALFIIMPMLQTNDCTGQVPVEMVPDVRVVQIRHINHKPMEEKTAHQEIRKIPEPLVPKTPAAPDIRPERLELSFTIDPDFQPAMKGLSSLPVDLGFDAVINTDGIFSAADLDAPVGIQVRVPPVYPLRARERRIEGWVNVKLLVDTSGRVEHAEVIEAQPEGYFEKSVLDCVRKWKLTPPVVGGEPVKAWMVTKIRFILD
jgi:protein TonB